MAVKIRKGTKADAEKFDADFQAALTEYSQNPTPETQARLTELYESGSGYTSGCGACRNGRALFIRGLAAMASGDASGGLAQVKGGFAAVGFKLDRMKKFFGG